jgi:hypothetical protein
MPPAAAPAVPVPAVPEPPWLADVPAVAVGAPLLAVPPSGVSDAEPAELLPPRLEPVPAVVKVGVPAVDAGVDGSFELEQPNAAK